MLLRKMSRVLPQKQASSKLTKQKRKVFIAHAFIMLHMHFTCVTVSKTFVGYQGKSNRMRNYRKLVARIEFRNVFYHYQF